MPQHNILVKLLTNSNLIVFKFFIKNSIFIISLFHNTLINLFNSKHNSYSNKQRTISDDGTQVISSDNKSLLSKHHHMRSDRRFSYNIHSSDKRLQCSISIMCIISYESNTLLLLLILNTLNKMVTLINMLDIRCKLNVLEAKM